MDAFPPIAAFVFGAVIGSFLNVVSLRYGTGKGLGGRSMCMSCGKTLTWRELVPLASFIAQRGKCRGCGTKVSWQYPLIELATGAIFAGIIVRFPPVSALAALSDIIYMASACFLMPILAYDWRHKVIPDGLVYSFDALALASVFLGGQSWLHAPHIWTILAGPILALPFAFLWLVSRGKWMGLGDAKLALGIGWILGLNAGLNAFVLAFWAGAVIGVAWMLMRFGRFKAGLEVPFGPFLIAGLYAALFGLEVVDARVLLSLFRV